MVQFSSSLLGIEKILPALGKSYLKELKMADGAISRLFKNQQSTAMSNALPAPNGYYLQITKCYRTKLLALISNDNPARVDKCLQPIFHRRRSLYLVAGSEAGRCDSRSQFSSLRMLEAALM